MHKSEQVTKKENADREETRYDAKEESKNKYGESQKKHEKKEDLDTGKVRIKEEHPMFDIKI